MHGDQGAHVVPFHSSWLIRRFAMGECHHLVSGGQEEGKEGRRKGREGEGTLSICSSMYTPREPKYARVPLQ